MSKPDDIPQDVWEIAQAVESDCINATWNGSARGSRTISETIIARAILSERTKAAEIAENYKWDEHELQQATECGYALHDQAISISQAIRKGGKE